ncbi:hypothetical protein BGZ83_003824, partial [Gryganskiella cystojenkinii]
MEDAEVEDMDKDKTPDADDDEATKRKKARKEEPTSKHLRGLEVVICQLIDDAASWAEVTMATLEKTLHERDKYTMDQKNAAIKIVNKLRLFAPRKDPNGKVPHHILAVGPFCRLSILLLRALGYKDFTRKLCPISACGTRQALPVGCNGICEILCSETPGHFDVFDHKGNVKSRTIFTGKPQVSDCIFRSFFDMNTVHNQCRKYNLKFADRFIYVDRSTIQILGTAIKDTPKNLWGEKKKRNRGPKGSSGAGDQLQELRESGVSVEEAKARAAVLAETIQCENKALGYLNRQLAKEEAAQKSLEVEFADLKLDYQKAISEQQHKLVSGDHAGSVEYGPQHASSDK